MNHGHHAEKKGTPPADEVGSIPSSPFAKALLIAALAFGVVALFQLVGACQTASPSVITETVKRITADGVVTPAEAQELVDVAGGRAVDWVQLLGAAAASVLSALTGMKLGKRAAVAALGPEIARAHARIDDVQGGP